MRFVRIGRTIQLAIESGEDLRGILDLDESHWVATSAPVAAFRCDAGLLNLIDSDASGRITTDELRAAVRWMLQRIADPGILPTRSRELPLKAIQADAETGRALVESVRYVLEAFGTPDAEVITLEQVQTFIAGIEARLLNGDGIVPPEAARREDVAAFLKTLVEAGWGVPGSGGRPGIGAAQLQGFFDGVQAYIDWQRKGALCSPDAVSEVKPFGEATAERYDILRAQAEAVDTFFRLCHVLQFDPRAAKRAGGADSALDALDPTDREAVDRCLHELPMARPNVDVALPLDQESVNPLYHGWLASFREQIVKPILGEIPSHLDDAGWQRIRAAFAPYEAYRKSRPATFTDAVSPERLEACHDEAYREAVRELIADDAKVAQILSQVRDVEKLLLYSTALLEFANNFVSFPYLYQFDARAMFEMGSAVIDGRWFTFAVRVEDPAAHMAAAKSGDLFIMYLEVTGTGSSKFTVAVPVTSEAKGNLALGKRGVFFDTARREYDARITHILENPISLREALVAPFVKLWQLAQGKIESWSSAAEKNLQTEFAKGLTSKDQPVPAPAQSAPPPPQVASRGAGMFLGMGVTAAALGSSFAFVTKTFSGMTPSHVLYSLGGAAAVVMLPISLVAIIKLRRQDLSVLLEGCGWAINARMRLNRQQRHQFSRRTPYPVGAEGAPRSRALRTVLFSILGLLLVLALVQTCRRQREAESNPVLELSPAALPARHIGAAPEADFSAPPPDEPVQ